MGLRSVAIPRKGGDNMRRKAALALTGALTLAGLVVAAPAADAAAPQCTDDGWRVFNNPYDNRVQMWFPAHSPETFAGLGYGYWSCSLVQGNKGYGVRELQFELNECYGEHLERDGDFGRLTKEALVRAQQSHGITANGQYGPQSARTLRHPFYNWATGYEGCWTLKDFGYPGDSG
jgi:peptidoglycan hydrolase-like protein with peptidoglycan-binding domain